MLKDYPGESIQSYFLRSLLIYGEFDFSTIISPDGRWFKQPKMPTVITNWLDDNSNHVLINLVQRSITDHIPTDYRTNPFFYVNYVKSIFYGVKLKPSKSYVMPRLNKEKVEIKFCATCIKEAIRFYGVGFFKSDWLFKNKCDLHNCNLIVLGQSTRKSVAIALREALSGRGLEHQANKKSIQTFSFKDSRLDKHSFFSEPITPCLYNRLPVIVRHFTREYMNNPPKIGDVDYFRKMPRYYNEVRHNGGLYKERDDFVIGSFFDDVAKYNYNTVHEYFDLNCEVVEALSPLSNDTTSVKMQAPVKRNCYKCNEHNESCPLSPLIFNTREQEGPRLEAKNYCDEIIRPSANYKPNIRIP